ncbi:MAG: hypothetical protein M3R16_03395, partial [Pseudomonadota bacterium]|nr:hypothetical protein [Pseudomonadota bacterium]
FSHEPAQAWAARAGAEVPSKGQSLRLLSQRFSNARYADTGSRQAGDEQKELLVDIRTHRP